MPEERTIGDLTKDAAHHLGDMVSSEIKLAKAEIAEGAKALSAGLVVVIAGAAVGAAALTLALLGVAYGLSESMPMWAACLVAAAIGAAVALMLVLAGRAAMTPKALSLPKTHEQVSRDVKNIAEHVPS